MSADVQGATLSALLAILHPADRVLVLRRLAPETGSLCCLGCGYEHNCSVRGCAICRTAAERIGQMAAEDAAPRKLASPQWIPVEEHLPAPETEVLLRVHGQEDRLRYVGMRKPFPPDRRLWPVGTMASDWTVFGWNYFVEPHVTHWAPLPAEEEP